MFDVLHSPGMERELATSPDPITVAEALYAAWVKKLQATHSIQREADILSVWKWEAVDTINTVLVEQMQTAGYLRRVEDITDDWQQDDHFDDLRPVYRLVCRGALAAGTC